MTSKDGLRLHPKIEAEWLEKMESDSAMNDIPTIEVSSDDLADILRENQRLRARETELLANNSALVIENRKLRGYFSGGDERFSSLLRGEVAAFMHAFDQPMRDEPGIPDEKIVRLRVELILEEAFEFASACLGNGDVWADMFEQPRLYTRQYPRVNVDLPALADALADLAYVTEGAWLSFGISPQPVLDAVHEANMAKLGGGVDPTTGKVQKSSTWTPPDIARILREQGWRG